MICVFYPWWLDTPGRIDVCLHACMTCVDLQVIYKARGCRFHVTLRGRADRRMYVSCKHFISFPATSCSLKQEQFRVIYSSSTWKLFIVQQISYLVASKCCPFSAIINIPELEVIKSHGWLWKLRGSGPLWMCVALWRVAELNGKWRLHRGKVHFD
jgi:hypothetical protein